MNDFTSSLSFLRCVNEVETIQGNKQIIIKQHNATLHTLFDFNSKAMTTLLPGDIVPAQFLPHNQGSSKTLTLGPALRFTPPSTIRATAAGTLAVDERKNAVWLETNSGGKVSVHMSGLRRSIISDARHSTTQSSVISSSQPYTTPRSTSITAPSHPTPNSPHSPNLLLRARARKQGRSYKQAASSMLVSHSRTNTWNPNWNAYILPLENQKV